MFTWPGFQYARHLERLAEALEAVERGDVKRLMVFMPPRHGKSEMVSVRFPAWFLGRNPERRVILTSYAGGLALSFSRLVRNLVQGEEFGRLFGAMSSVEEAVAVAADSRSAEAWDLAGHRGGMVAAGVGGGITGKGADLLIIDDPVKDRAEAESVATREGVWNWFTATAYTRLEVGGRVVLMMTRWHEDDLAGRLLRQMREVEGADRWEVLSLPAVGRGRGRQDLQDLVVRPAVAGGAQEGARSETGPSGRETGPSGRETGPSGRETGPSGEGGGQDLQDLQEGEVVRPVITSSAQEGGGSVSPLLCGDRDRPQQEVGGDWRREGEALWPERYDVRALASTRATIGTYDFEALYQQSPMPPGGGMIKRGWFGSVEGAPEGVRWVRYWDLAVSTKASADRTASICVGLGTDGTLYLADGVRGRWEWPDARAEMIRVAKGEPGTAVGVEAVAYQLAAFQELMRERELANRAIYAVNVTKDKLSRALPWIARAEAGKVKILGPRAAWVEDFLEEVSVFPVGKHDDYIDSVSGGVEMVTQTVLSGQLFF